MRSSRNLTIAAAVATALVAAPWAPGKSKPKDKSFPKAGAATPAPGSGAPAVAPGATPDPNSGRLSLPLVEGRPSTGLKIPYYDTTGRLQMNYTIGIATKLDPDHVEMKEAQVETFNEEGETDMHIEMPVSILDLNTRVITSNTKATIKREDFIVTGDSVAFNTATKQGKLIGHVHMIIYDLHDEAATPTEKPSTDAPAPAAP